MIGFKNFDFYLLKKKNPMINGRITQKDGLGRTITKNGGIF